MAKTGSLRKYFGDTYHGGVMYMHLWGEFCYHQPSCWDWSKSVPRWLVKHVFRRLDNIEGYKVNLEVDSSTLEYLQEHNPRLISRLKEYIRHGSLEIVDGTYAQPYSLLQSGESCIRQFYYGQKTIEGILGVYVNTYHKQEPFFFPQLPQILTKAGYKHAILRVHITHYGECPITKRERVMWTAPDGSAIDTVPNNIETDNPYTMTATVDRLQEYGTGCAKLGFKSILVTTGLDVAHDIDYLPTFKSDFADKLLPREVEFFTGEWIGWGMSDNRIKKIQNEGYIFVTLSQYFEAEKPVKETLELEADDFIFKYKFGQLGDAMLRRNKEAENKVYDAETFASFVRMLKGTLLLTEDSQKEMWKSLLLSQNHDFHACPTAYSYGVASSPCNTSLEFTNLSRDRAAKIIDESLDYLIADIDTSRKGTGRGDAVALVVFNQLLGERISTAETTVTCPRGFAERLCLRDGHKEVPVDVTDLRYYEDGSIFKANITFNTELPSLGYRVYYLEPAKEKPGNKVVDNMAGNCMESDLLKITFGQDGLIESVYDRRSGFEYLNTQYFKGNELTVDFGDGLQETKGKKCGIIITYGNIVSTMTTIGRIGDLKYEMVYRLYHGFPRLDCEIIIDFDTALSTKSMQDEFSKFRVTFNPSFEGRLFTDQPFSVYPSSKEVSAGYNFGCYTDGRHGITLVNNGNIGYLQDPGKNAKLSLVLAFGDKSYFYGALLLSGMQTFRYSLFFHDGDWKTGRSVRKSMEVLHPPYVRQTHLHTGPLPAYHSFLSTSHDNIIISACYPMEKGICLRLWETDRQKTGTHIKLNFDVKAVEETDLLGRTISKHDSDYIQFAPWEFKTLHVGL